MSVDLLRVQAFRPPAPIPPAERLGFIALLKVLGRNPLECWSQDFFCEPITRLALRLGQAFVVNDPASRDESRMPFLRSSGVAYDAFGTLRRGISRRGVSRSRRIS